MVRDNEAKKQALTFASEVSAWARQLHLQNTGPGAEVEDVCIAEQLTAREFQILNLLAQGTDTDSIASQLVIGKTTVRNHIQRILHKLGVHSRLEAVTYARDHHLLD
ncbi:MAG: response regulator transcription factor [Caldilineaceae bacterium]|nr:response regulator transcription factor [Caldilineaceae bacterium]